MRTVNVADLQNDLTAYVDYARAGEEVIIHDHDRAVAKLIPFAEEDLGNQEWKKAYFSEESLALEAAGILRLPKKPFDREAFLKMPEARLKDGVSAVQALIDDREDRV